MFEVIAGLAPVGILVLGIGVIALLAVVVEEVL